MEDVVTMLEGSGKYLEYELLMPYYHIKQVSNQSLRVRIVTAFNYWLQIPEKEMEEILDIMNIYHVSSLMTDDILHRKKERQGLATAHSVYGLPWATNTNLLVFNKAIERCIDFHPQGSLIFIEQSLEWCRGQGKEVYWRDNFVCPREDEYTEAVQQKTKGMIFLAVRLMQLLSKNQRDYSEFGNTIGYYYQLRDDYCNIMIPKALEGRPGQMSNDDYYMDLTEGKFTLPIIHANRSADKEKSATVLNILKQHTTDITVKRHCISLLEELGSLEYTRKVLSELDQQLRTQIQRLGGNPPMIAILNELISWKTLSL